MIWIIFTIWCVFAFVCAILDNKTEHCIFGILLVMSTIAMFYVPYFLITF